MISRHPALKRLGIVAIPFLLFFPTSADFLFSFETPQPVTLSSVGIGDPPVEPESPETPSAPAGAVEDACKKALLAYLYETLGSGEFSRLKDPVDTLILPNYQDYITKIEIVSVSRLPGGDAAVVSATVTIDAAAVTDYLENIKKLEAAPAAPRRLSAAEKENLISRAQAIYIQGEVASDILLDRMRGIESFLSARTLFETAESTEGVYRCLMGIGRAHASLGDVAAARTDFERALELAAVLGRADYAAAARIARARLMAASGDPIGAGREIEAVLADPSISGYNGLVGEALMVAGEIDFAGGRYESAETKLGRAVGIFEGLADVKRLTVAHLLRGRVLIAAGDTPAAVESFKLAKVLADRVDDKISETEALIGMSRAYRVGGDPKTASLYLTDALASSRGSGWAAGEIASLCETAYTEMDLGDLAAARLTAAAAHTAALSGRDPVLIAATLLVLGEVLRSSGDNNAAFEAFLSCVTASSDIRVVGRDMPFLFFGDDQRDAALSGLIVLSEAVGRQKKVPAAGAGYEGAVVMREVLFDPPAVGLRDAALIRLFREAAMRAIAPEGVSLSGESVGLSEDSRTEAVRLNDEAVGSLLEVEKRISGEAPRLAALIGIKYPDPSDISRTLPENAALVHYVTGPAGAFALVVTRRGTSIIRLPEGYEEISAATVRLNEAAGVLRVGADGEIPLDFTEASTALTSMLIAPILPAIAGVTAIGISPGTSFPAFPIQALGRYTDEGAYRFLGEDYALFGTSWLSPTVSGDAPGVNAPAGYDVLIVGDMDLPVSTTPEEPTDQEAPGETEGQDKQAPHDDGSLRIARSSPESPWWDIRTRLFVLTRAGLWGATEFSRFEYLSYLLSRPVMTVPAGAAPEAASYQVYTTIGASRERPVLSGYADAVRLSAAGLRSGASADWVRMLMIGNFVSEHR